MCLPSARGREVTMCSKAFPAPHPLSPEYLWTVTQACAEWNFPLSDGTPIGSDWLTEECDCSVKSPPSRLFAPFHRCRLDFPWCTSVELSLRGKWTEFDSVWSLNDSSKRAESEWQEHEVWFWLTGAWVSILWPLLSLPLSTATVLSRALPEGCWNTTSTTSFTREKHFYHTKHFYHVVLCHFLFELLLGSLNWAWLKMNGAQSLSMEWSPHSPLL